MSLTDNKNVLPLLLAGVILLIMSTAVVMYPTGAGPIAAPQGQRGALPDDPPPALPESRSTEANTASAARDMRVDAQPRVAGSAAALHAVPSAR